MLQILLNEVAELSITFSEIRSKTCCFITVEATGIQAFCCIYVILINCGNVKVLAFSSNHTTNETSQDKDMEDQNGAPHTELTNINSDNIELVLQGCSFIWLVFNSCHDLTFDCHITNNNGHEPSLSSLDGSTR